VAVRRGLDLSGDRVSAQMSLPAQAQRREGIVLFLMTATLAATVTPAACLHRAKGPETQRS
jgi:hypothetical protein